MYVCMYVCIYIYILMMMTCDKMLPVPLRSRSRNLSFAASSTEVSDGTEQRSDQPVGPTAVVVDGEDDIPFGNDKP